MVKRTRRKRTKNEYFTKVHENAIIEYARITDQSRRTELYVSLIQPAFNEMVNKIIYTYKFTTLPNVETLAEECKIWLTTILDKYDPSKGSKAFSYFSVVTKHWFIHKIKKNSKKNRTELSYEEMLEKGNSELKAMSEGEGHFYVDRRAQAEFWLLLMTNLDKWNHAGLKENEKKVLDAVKMVMSNVDNIEILNKKAVYLYLREITGLNTKQVVNNLNKLREKYRLFKNKWDRSEI